MSGERVGGGEPGWQVDQQVGIRVAEAIASVPKQDEERLGFRPRYKPGSWDRRGWRASSSDWPRRGTRGRGDLRQHVGIVD
jgi:hypothetical protein